MGSVADWWEGPGLKPRFLLGWLFRSMHAPAPSVFVLRTNQVRFGAGFGGSHPFARTRKDVRLRFVVVRAFKGLAARQLISLFCES